MRACEGCRRRKIKCDAATTNSWPCAACTRLKLNCVPPTVSYEKDSNTPGVHTFELQTTDDYPTIPVGNISDYQRQPTISQPQHGHGPVGMHTQVQSQYAEPLPVYQPTPFMTATTGQDALQYSLPTTSLPQQDMKYQEVYSTPPSVSRTVSAMETGWKSEAGVVGSITSTAEVLSDAMGELKIDHLAIGKSLSYSFKD
jgi:hypothetical protein